MRAFFDAFGRAGLRRDTFCGAYGLAEHTVGVSVWGRGSVLLDAEAVARREVRITGEPGTEVNSCGRPSDGVHVRIVDPDTLVPLGEDRVGEIWVDSPSKADGYFGAAGTFEFNAKHTKFPRGYGLPGRTWNDRL